MTDDLPRKFCKVNFEDTSVTMLIVDELTKFGSTTPTIATIHSTDEYKIESIHDPQKISAWLINHSIYQEENQSDLPLFIFFEKVCRKAIRQFYFKYSDSDRDPTSEFLVDPMWPKVADILRKHGRLE